MAKGYLEKYDPAGGAIAYLESTVTVRKKRVPKEKAA
jgi:hypothetical protein